MVENTIGWAIFKDYLSGNGPPLPIIVVYYPTPKSIEQVQLERVEGADQELRTTESEFVPLPNVKNQESCRDFVASLLENDRIMKFKFEANQDYQLKAIESVTNLFKGTIPVLKLNYSSRTERRLLLLWPNCIDLDDEALLSNLKSVQAQNNLDEDVELEYIEEKIATVYWRKDPFAFLTFPLKWKLELAKPISNLRNYTGTFSLLRLEEIHCCRSFSCCP